MNKKGSFDGEQLILGKETIPAQRLVRADRRLNRLILTALEEDNEAMARVMQVNSGQTLVLRDLINSFASRHNADRIREERIKKGQDSNLDLFDCPYCGSAVDVTGFAPTPQRYCYYCDTIVTAEEPRPEDESDHPVSYTHLTLPTRS